jgi:dTDP-4-dehydrorhamnose reductase
VTTIGIIGANGQVGTEACLFLSLRPDVRVIPIARKPYASALLRTLGFECRHGSLNSPEETKRLTEGCDLVADFSVPQGSSPDIRAAMRANSSHAIKYATAKQFVYISTHGVFRLSTQHSRYRLYSHAKRYAERTAIQLGRAEGKEVYVLRLGHVHGVIQGVSRQYIENLRDEVAVLPDVPSFTVFVFSIAEALYNISQHKEAQGTYTLMSTPQWSWPDLHSYFCRMAGVEPRFKMEPFHEPTLKGDVKTAVRGFVGSIVKTITKEKELLDHLLSTHLPSEARRLRAGYNMKRAAAEIAVGESFIWRPSEQEFYSKGERMKSLSDSRLTMDEPTRQVKAKLARSIEHTLAHWQEGIPAATS